MRGIELEFLGGNCPVQGEGTIDGKAFYFRARGQSWTMGIGGSDPSGSPEWFYEEGYGDGPFDAGWMAVDEARALMEKAVGLWRGGRPSMEVRWLRGAPVAPAVG